MDDAEKHAVQLTRLAGQQKKHSRRVRALMVAGTALREVGYEIESKRLFLEAYEEARNHEMHAAAASAAIGVTALMVQRGERISAHEWLAVASQFGSRSNDATVRANLMGLDLRLRLQEGRYEGISTPAAQYALNAPNTRLRCLSELMQARIALRTEREIATNAFLEKLHELHGILLDSCSSDLSAIAIVEAFHCRKQPDSARVFLQEYVTHARRSRCSLAIELREPWTPPEDISQTKKEPIEALQTLHTKTSR